MDYKLYDPPANGYGFVKRRIVSITLLPAVIAKLDRLAEASGIGRSRYIELLIKRMEESTNGDEEKGR